MEIAKCTSCGANIKVDENKDAGVCPFCNTAYITKTAIENFNTNNTTNNSGTIINNYYGYSQQPIAEKIDNKIPPRPEINIVLAIIGFWFYIFPGILYISNIKKKQKEWDNKYSKNKDQ